MARNPLPLRKERYFRLSSQLALMDNAELRARFDESASSPGWGKNHTLEIGRSKVFVKRVPMTGLEYENMFSTRNLYDLPTYYNYGVGSAGFGVFRELIAHIKTTNWVLQGAISTFPLTYHYRIMPFAGARAEVDRERHDKYVEYWGSNASIGRYMLDRASAPYELVLFLEHIPYTLGPWLPEHPEKLQGALDDLRATITFLRANGIIHFDAHFWNVVTDGERAYLTDFGLVLDRSFTLAEEERAFFRRHTDYDYGEVLSGLGYLLVHSYEGLPDSEKARVREQCGIPEGAPYYDLMPALCDHVEEIAAGGLMKLHASSVASIARYRGIMTLMHAFYKDMQRNNRKDTKFRHTELRRQLRATGFVSTG